MPRRTVKESASEKWFKEITRAADEQPQIIPEIGVTIECRMLVKSTRDWEYVQETLDKCREFGSAEVVDYKVFEAG